MLKNTLLLFLLLFCLRSVKADWTPQHSNTLAWLHDVYFLNDSKGWIVGSNGTLLTTSDGGKNWEKHAVNTSDNIRQIHFLDEKNGWLLCERDVYSRGSEAKSYLLKTSDGGGTWTTVNFSASGRERISRIFFSAGGLGFAIGEAGAYFVLNDEGIAWKRKTAPVGYLLLDGLFTDNFHGVMTGAGGTVLFTEDAGVSWNKVEFSSKFGGKFNSAFFINNRNGWVVGTDGKIFQTISGGKFWREQNSTVTENLNDIFFVNTAEGWAAGDNGTILHTMTAGNVWMVEDSRSRHKIEKLFFKGAKGWGVGFGGTILSYQKDGKNNSTRPRFRR